MLISVDYFSLLFAASDGHQVVAASVQDLQVRRVLQAWRMRNLSCKTRGTGDVD